MDRREIYRDVIHTSYQRDEYMLRCNVCIAMAIAPELFTPSNAIKCLTIIEDALIEPDSLGIKTLDPKNQTMYKKFYDNSNDSDDYLIAHGFSYHNGPEWVWPYAYFLRAKFVFER